MRQCDEQQTEETKPEGDSVSMLVFRPTLPEIHLRLLKLCQLWIGVLPLIDELRIDHGGYFHGRVRVEPAAPSMWRSPITSVRRLDGWALTFRLPISSSIPFTWLVRHTAQGLRRTSVCSFANRNKRSFFCIRMFRRSSLLPPAFRRPDRCVSPYYSLLSSAQLGFSASLPK